MDPLEREDSSTYVRQPQTQSEASKPVRQTEPPRQKKKRGVAVLAFLLLLALLSAAALGWLWYQQNGRVSDIEADLSKSRNDVSRLESAAKAEAKLKDTDSVITDTTNSDSESLVMSVLAYTHAQTGLSNAKIDASVRNLKPPFASVNYANNSVQAGGGGVCILKKADTIWMVLYCAQADSEHTLALDQLFAVPASIKQ